MVTEITKIADNANHFALNYIAIALSPIHIGSGKELTNLEYFTDESTIFKINLNKIQKFDAKNPKYEVFNQILKFYDNNLKDLDSEFKKITDINLVAILKKTSQKLESVGSITPNKSIKLFTNFPNLYIPGSSIKGSINTAILANSLNLDNICDFRKIKNYLDSFFIKNSNLKKQLDLGIHFIIRDSNKISNSNFVITTTTVYEKSFKNVPTYKKSKIETQLQVLKPGSRFNITMSTKQDNKKYKGCIGMLKKHLKDSSAFYLKVWSKEKENREKSELADFYSADINGLLEKDNKAVLLRVGYGSGQLATTIFCGLEKQDSNYFNNPLKNINRKGRRLENPIKPSYIMPMGWLLLIPENVSKINDQDIEKFSKKLNEVIK